MKKGIIAGLFAVTVFCLIGCGGSGGGDSSTSENGDTGSEYTLIPWIDTHTHPLGTETDCTTIECMATSIELMDQYGVRKAILMHPPAPGTSQQKEELIHTVASYYPDRFFYGGGGNTLNSLIQRGPDTGTAAPALVQQFEDNFQAIVDTGDVVVFGELAAMHLSYNENHAFEEKPANSDLFLRLADLAAPLGIPIDIHMDVVEEEMATPTFFTNLSSLNPVTLEENITAFEELLDHNLSSKIMLVHVGRDTTGDMTADLMGRLMSAHSNLYLQIHPIFGPLRSQNAIVDGSGTIRSEWMSLIEQYSDRIVLGSDEFFSGELETNSLDNVQDFLQQLPEELATKIGCTNPVAIYGLPSGC